MKGKPLADAQAAALTFISHLDLEGQDQSSVVSYASYSRLDEKLTQDYQELDAAINALRADGGTNIAAGIAEATGELTSSRHNPNAVPVIILLTDGEADGGDEAVLDAANMAKAQGIRIITIGLGEDVNETLLRTIASVDTEYYFAPTSTELEAIYEAIAWILSCTQTPSSGG